MTVFFNLIRLEKVIVRSPGVALTTVIVGSGSRRMPLGTGSEDEPVEIEFNAVAQIILALLLGGAKVIQALTGFLPVWRAKLVRPRSLKTAGKADVAPTRLIR